MTKEELIEELEKLPVGAVVEVYDFTKMKYSTINCVLPADEDGPATIMVGVPAT